MLATSTDGLTFQRNNFILTDQGDVPDIVVDNRGFIFVYYVGWTVGSENNKTVCAVSPDGGTTWFYKRVNLTGFEPVPPDAVDPDVQFLANGTFRLYLTHDPDGQGPRIFRGESTSGLDFTNAGVAFSHLPDFAIDPSAVLVPQTQIWHLFTAGGPNQYWHATSPDGASFSFLKEIQFIDDEGDSCVPSNGLAVDGAVRLYAFKQDAQVQTQIKSFSSTDGIVWTPESGARLTLDESSGLESQYVKDAAVTRLPGGRFLMVYVTRIPAPGAP
ncbi:MAG TPA: hypothetical protein VNO81_07120 [Candidatus Nitrosotenuis sp.]|nr:hypothetical protein [Candidatus Nitrosotenuis sp.]